MRPLLLFLLIFTFISCRDDKQQLPDSIIKPEKMEAVLWDLLRADIFARDYIMRDSLRQEKNFSLYASILRIHEVNQDEFEESFAYYRSHPDLFRSVLDSMETKSRLLTNPPVNPAPDTAIKFRDPKKTGLPYAQ